MVNVTALSEDLSVFARDKGCSFDWELVEYASAKRSTGPDRDAMLVYAPLLRVVLLHAPNALPGLVPLRQVWMHLHRRFKIRNGHWDMGVEGWATKCVDVLRVACKHLAQLKANPCKWCPPELQELVDMVELSPTSPTKAEFPEKQSGLSSSTEQLGDVKDCSSDVEFCGFVCRRSPCRGMGRLRFETHTNGNPNVCGSSGAAYFLGVNKLLAWQ